MDALFVSLGVNGEDEIRSALELARSGEHMSLDDTQEAVIEPLRDILAREPQRRLAVLLFPAPTQTYAHATREATPCRR